MLLNFGARLNKQDGEGNTALMLSSISKAVGATECMMKMVEARSHNLNLDVKNNNSFHASELILEGCPGQTVEKTKQQRQNLKIANKYGMVDQDIECRKARESMYSKDGSIRGSINQRN